MIEIVEYYTNPEAANDTKKSLIDKKSADMKDTTATGRSTSASDESRGTRDPLASMDKEEEDKM